VADLIKNNPTFANFVKERNKHPESHNLVLQAFLVTPVQRIPRYKLLLEDLYKHTPTDHPDYKSLNEAIKLITDGIIY
jgi:FYVE/RhoGEF/PH domain-containing protein 3